MYLEVLTQIHGLCLAVLVFRYDVTADEAIRSAAYFREHCTTILGLCTTSSFEWLNFEYVILSLPYIIIIKITMEKIQFVFASFSFSAGII